MTPEQFERAERLFDRALELAMSERAPFLDSNCGEDTVVRRRVELMLAEHVTQTSFLDKPALGQSFHVKDAIETGADRFADEIAVGGRYQSLMKIAEGGFGVVYRAQQVVPVRRPVALKVLKLGMDTRQILGRFEAERQTLALMDHPNIATVFDAGATVGGRPYFVMELVAGVPITEYCDSARLDVTSRIQVFSQVCRAVQHAHQKGVIHRDLKPSNVLVAAKDGAPLAKVIDFGIARAVKRDAVQATLMTQEGSWVGTPHYMSPEQAGGGTDVDTRTDIYSLGVILYQILAGVTPFDAEALSAAKRGDRSPPRPSLRVTQLDSKASAIVSQRSTDSFALARTLRGDLDWIVLKCLEHDRSRRYATAEALDADLHRFLRHEPILARPPSRADWVRKFVRRNRAAVAAVTVATLALISGLVLSLIGFSQAQRQRAIADARNEELRFKLYVSQIERAQRIIETDGSEAVKPTLEQCEPSLRGWEWRRLCWLADRSEASVKAHAGGVSVVACSSDGQRYLTAGADGKARIWDAVDLRVLHELPVASTGIGVCSARFSPDGSLVACGSQEGELSLWDAANAHRIRTIATPHRPLGGIAFSPDNQRVAVCSWYAPTDVYSVATGELVMTLDPRAGAGSSVEYSPEGARILVGSPHNEVVVCSADDGSVLVAERGADFVVWDAKFSPDGSRMVSLGKDGQIWMRDAGDGTLIYKVATGRQDPRTIDFSRDGNLLAVSGADGIVTLFKAQNGEKSYSFRGHERPVNDVAFVPGGTKLISADADGTLRRWDLTRKTGDLRYQHSNTLCCAEFAVNDSVVFCSGWSSGVIRFDLPSRTKQASELLDIASSISAQPDGRRVVVFCCSASIGSAVMLLDESLKPVYTWPASGDIGVALSADGQRVLFSAPDKKLVLHNADTGELVWRMEGGEPYRCAALAPDGRTVVSGHASGRVRLWDSDKGSPVGEWVAYEGSAVTRMVFAPSGQYFLTLGENGQMKVWSWPQRELKATLPTEPVTALAINPDGTRVATAGDDHMVRIWSVERREQTMTAGRHSGGVSSLAFSADGSLLASTSDDHILDVWRSQPGTGR